MEEDRKDQQGASQSSDESEAKSYGYKAIRTELVAFWREWHSLLDYYFTGNWLVSTVVQVAIGCLFCAVIIIMFRPIWWAYIAVALLGNILLFALFKTFDKRMLEPPATLPTTHLATSPTTPDATKTEDFFIRFSGSLKNEGPPPNYAIWLLSGSGVDQRRFPVATVVQFEIQNRSDRVGNLMSYSIETQLPSGIWQTAHSLNMRPTDHLVIFLSGKPTTIELLSQPFNSVIASPFAPGEKRYGCVCLMYADGHFPSNCRFVYRDTFHNEAAKDIVMPLDFNRLPDQADDLGFKIGEPIDISHIMVAPAISITQPTIAAPETQPAFSVRATIAHYICEANPIPPIWVLARDNRAAIPVHVAMFIKLVNLRHISVMIEECSMETQKPSGEWEELSAIQHFGTLLVTDDFKTFATLMPHKALAGELRNQTLTPGDTARGWVFLENPTGFTSAFRMRMWDTAGRESIEPIAITRTDESIPRLDVVWYETDNRHQFSDLSKHPNLSELKIEWPPNAT